MDKEAQWATFHGIANRHNLAHTHTLTQYIDKTSYSGIQSFTMHVAICLVGAYCMPGNELGTAEIYWVLKSKYTDKTVVL